MRRIGVEQLLGGWLIVSFIFGLAGFAHAQTPNEVQRKFAALRSDKIPRNCASATSWLYANRLRLKDAMLEELYRTDRQGRDALLTILFQTPGLESEQRFERLVVARLSEEDRYVGNFDLDPDAVEPAPGDLKLAIFSTAHREFRAAHHDAWIYIDAHFEAFEPLLAAGIGASKSMWMLWGTAWMFKKYGVLAAHPALFTPAVLDLAAVNLREDEVSYNASLAARLFLLLGDQSLPVLRQAADAHDGQERNLARALIDALKGSRRGFGYLCARVGLVNTPVDSAASFPPWIEQAGEPYWHNDKLYP